MRAPGFGLALALAAAAPAFAQFSPNQELPLPLLAPVGPSGVAFIVRGLEPSLRVGPDGAVYVVSIRGVPTGVDLHRYFAPVDGPPNPDGTYPFKYEGRPDGCGIFAVGCNLLGIAEGGGDADIAVNFPFSGVPNLALTSLTLAPGITATHSIDRGDSFSQPNPVAALIPGDDRMWNDAIDAQTVYLSYHDVLTFNIEVQRSNDGGQTYLAGLGEAIDPQTFPAAGGVPPTNTANILGAIRVDRSGCPSRGNLYQIFVAPDSAVENALGQPFRSVYVGVSRDVRLGLSVFSFTDHKVFTGPTGSSNENIFPALAVDSFANVYAAWSDNANIFYSFSTDLGTTWAPAIRVNSGATVGKANVFPWIDAEANGHVAVAWLGGDRAGDSNSASIHAPCPASATCPGSQCTCMTGWTNWNAYVAETVNGHDSAPVFTQAAASDHVIHRGTVSTGGLGGGANRNLGDFFQIGFDPLHRLNVAFSDDHKVNPAGPNNGPDNPSTRRLIRANFTHQLLPTAGIGSGETCAGAAEEVEDIEGEGELENGDDDFGFIGRSNPQNGALRYRDRAAGIEVRSSNGVGALSLVGSCGTLEGAAKVNGKLGYNFRATGCDLGFPGAGKDTFSISVTGPNFSYSKAGTLFSGDIRRH
jgi:hypothetical protein